MAYEILQNDIKDGGYWNADLVKWARNVTLAINTILGNLGGSGIFGVPGLAIGSTPANIANLAFTYIITGNEVSKGAVAAGTAPGTDVVPQALFGAVALDINAAGTITVAKSPANATGYASAALAVAALPAVGAGLVRMGWASVTKSDGAFTFGTTSLAASNTTVAYTDAPSVFDNLATLAGTTLVMTKG